MMMMMPLIYIGSETEGYKFSKSQEKVNYLVYKLFAKNGK